MARKSDGFRFVKTLDGGPPAKGWYDLKVASVYEGDVLRLNSVGSVVIAAANSQQIVGVAGANVLANHATTSMPVYLADGNNVFEAKMLASRSAHYLVGDIVNLAVATTHNFRITGTNYGGTATGCVRVVGYHPDTVPGTAAAGNRYWVTFLPTANAVTGSGAVTK